MQSIPAGIIKKRIFSLKAEGVSMLPLLRPGDVLFFKKIKFHQAKVNEIILVKKANKEIVHRVIYRKKNYLVTKGDHNPLSDGRIKPEQVCAKVIAVKRNGKKFDLGSLYLFQSTLYFTEITKVTRAFHDKNIQYVILKGLPLHLYYEKKHPTRLYADCDVLIDAEDFGKAGKLLNSYGYRKIDTPLSDLHKRLKNKITEVSYYKLINNFPVVFDVHFEVSFLINQFGRLEALYPEKLVKEISSRFLQEKKVVNIHGSTFPLLSHENLIFYLALHFFHHNYRGIFRLHFLDQVIRFRAREKDLHKLISDINKYQVQNFVYPVFWFLQKYYMTPGAAMVLKSINIKSKELKYIKENILNISVFDDEQRVQAGITRFKNIFYLSPSPFWKKLTVIFNLQIIYSVFWVGYLKMRRFFRRSSNSGN